MPGFLNIKYIIYTAFRLSPFILVSFFTLSSVLNQDLKGLIYLAGLLFACFICVLMNNIQMISHIIPSEMEPICNSLTLSETGRLSNIPLSMVVFAYTFGYLLFIIVSYGLASQNIPTLIIFPVLIIAEGIWNTVYKCVSPMAIIAGLVIGGLWGVIWSLIIKRTGAINIQYFNGVSNAQSCSRPSKQKFKCTMKQ